MTAARFILVGGGVRSGKSAFALARASRFGEKLAFVATAQAFDDEMRERIAAHQAERDARFTTFEAPYELARAVASLRSFDAAVVDCLTLWLSNRLLADERPSAHDAAIEELALALRGAPCPVIVVTNEVGMGIVPEHRLARTFRDLAGRAHQRLAREADELYAAMMGVVLRLRPAPVEIAVTGR
ncbi:MAG TPA: bifunctional adenosylcobinamide kinase/adenosylcobinamide-phosphate guanylyltransferase [Polyangiaceae bacterium]|jgi:adenosylcobinamide kinase/adenosylcobinamide-phosphate guanylyltransferase